MSKSLVRGLCLFALVASLALRIQANQVRLAMLNDFDIGAAITAVISEHGYGLRENPVKPPKMLAAAVYFQRPECSQPSFALPYLISTEARPMLTRLNKPEFLRSYFYMERSWREQNRVSMVMEWMKYTVLDIFGASPYVPFKQAILLADPPGCTSRASIEWRAVWDRNRFRRAMNGNSSPHAGS